MWYTTSVGKVVMWLLWIAMALGGILLVGPDTLGYLVYD